MIPWKQKKSFFNLVCMFVHLIKTQKEWPQVEKSDSCQYLQMGQYRASCEQGSMSVLDSWYQAKGWRSTGIVQPQS